MRAENEHIVASGYSIVREIGRGGMGVVYEAWDNRLDRRIAVKMLHPYLFSDQQVGDRLLREARLAARIEHPNVVRVYDVEMVEGRLAIEMQYIDGGALPDVLASGALPAHQAADLLGQILEALAACHAQGVIHCDLKPGNLLVAMEGKIFLSDFGIARALSSVECAAAITPATSGPLWGTPQYTPPEAWQGLEPMPQWDLYAAGVIIYEALCGQLPFEGRTPMAVMLEKHSRCLPSIALRRTDLSPGFIELVDDLVSNDSSRRPVSAQAALKRLQALPEYKLRDTNTQPLRPAAKPATRPMQPISLAPFPPSERMPPGTTGPMARPSRQPVRFMAALIVILLAACGALAYNLWHSYQSAAEVAAKTPAYNGELLNLASSSNRAFFSYDDGIHGRELWCANDDGEPWMVADINPGPNGSNPRRFFVRQDGTMFFAATTEETGEELWHCSTDHPQANVRLVRDILPGPMGSEPQVLCDWQSVALLYATTLTHGRELWATNAREAQTAIVADLAPGTNWSQPMDPGFTNEGRYVYVRSFTGDGQFTVQYDFETNSTKRIAECDGSWYSIFKGKLYYDFPTSEHGRELWCYDPEIDKAELLIDILPGAGSGNPSGFFVHDGLMFFQATTDTDGAELWVTDGTKAGTRLFRQFHPGGGGGTPHALIDAGHVFFLKATSEQAGLELYRVAYPDVSLVSDLRPGIASSVPYNMNVNHGWLYFSADDGIVGEELWRVSVDDAEAKPELVADLLPGSKGVEPHLMRWATPNVGFFVGTDADGIQHLYRLNTEGESKKITQLRLIRPVKEEK